MDKPTIEQALFHYGVKGMHWGVRRRYAEKLRTQANLHKVASKGEKGFVNRYVQVEAAKRIGPVDLMKGGGLKGANARKAKRLEAQAKRLESGKLMTKDVLGLIATTSYADLVLSGRDKYRKG